MLALKIAVTGGKGGTGKSTVAVNLAVALALRGIKTALADLDVEGCVDALLLNADTRVAKRVSVMIPYIVYGRCDACGDCVRVCDTGALTAVRGGKPFLIPRLCSGCSACYYACRRSAILKGWRVIGELLEGEVNLGGPRLRVVAGRLREGEEHVAPMVIRARREAFRIAEEWGAEALVVDTSAGTGLSVASAVIGSDLAVVVTEPTPLGAHDLRAVLKLLKNLGIHAWVVINKSGIAPESVLEPVVREFHVPVKARIPYSRDMVSAYVSGKPAVMAGVKEAEPITRLAAEVATLLGRGGSGEAA